MMGASIRAHAARTALPFIHPDYMPELYALRGVGDCMVPVIADGALLTFDKSEKPEPGDVVGIVFTRDFAPQWGAPGCVKRLRLALPPAELGQGMAGLIVVEQLNPRRTFTFQSKDVLAVHKCVGLAELDPDDGVRARFRTTQEAPRC